MEVAKPFSSAAVWRRRFNGVQMNPSLAEAIQAAGARDKAEA
jgi:hypothetical protein